MSMIYKEFTLPKGDQKIMINLNWVSEVKCIGVYKRPLDLKQYTEITMYSGNQHLVLEPYEEVKDILFKSMTENL